MGWLRNSFWNFRMAATYWKYVVHRFCLHSLISTVLSSPYFLFYQGNSCKIKRVLVYLWYFAVLWRTAGFLLYRLKNCHSWNVQYLFWLITKLLTTILTGRYVLFLTCLVLGTLDLGYGLISPGIRAFLFGYLIYACLDRELILVLIGYIFFFAFCDGEGGVINYVSFLLGVPTTNSVSHCLDAE